MVADAARELGALDEYVNGIRELQEFGDPRDTELQEAIARAIARGERDRLELRNRLDELMGPAAAP